MREKYQNVFSNYITADRERIAVLHHLYWYKPMLGDLFLCVLGKDALQSSNHKIEVQALFMECLILMPQVGLDSMEMQESVRGSTGI